MLEKIDITETLPIPIKFYAIEKPIFFVQEINCLLKG